MAFDPAGDYPIGQRRPELVTTPSGVPLEDVSIAALRAGTLAWEDLRATSETLQRQADVALAAGRAPLSDALSRAAELAGVPADTILEIYTALRPHRSTAEELEACAVRLEEMQASLTAGFVREAAAVYARRGLLAGERAPV